MATLKKYNLAGKENGEVSIEDTLLDHPVNSQMVKDYLVIQRANKRQWSASTQSRSEVSHSKKKPYAQKGTGNARQGFLGSPQFRGGGRVHAPRPKFDQTIHMNKKERRAAIRHLLGEKVKEHGHILEYDPLKEPQTKTLYQFLKALSLSGKRVLFIADKPEEKSETYKTLSLSLRNIPKVEFVYLPNVSGSDLALACELIILESAVDGVKETLGGKQ